MVRFTLVLTLAAVLADSSPGIAQPVVPDKVGFAADTVRAYLPADGKLIEQGKIGKEYIGLALGHEVTADGQKVLVGPKLESKGIDFGDGYLAINIGAHFETEQVGATLAFNATARIYLKVEDEFKVVLTVDEDRLKVAGDNAGGKLAVAVGKEKIKDVLRRELSKLGDDVTKKIREQKIPAELKYVVIHPEGIDVVKNKPVPKPASDFIVSAKLHFHTTTDDKEGGKVTVEFFSDENNIFATVPPLKERIQLPQPFLRLPQQRRPRKPVTPPNIWIESDETSWAEESRKEFEHKFEKPIPMPQKILFARINLTEAGVENIGWNFEATLVLNTQSGKEIVFEGVKLRLDTTNMRYPGTARLTIPRVR